MTENQGSIPERGPEIRLPHPRKAAGAQITQSRLGEVVKKITVDGQWSSYWNENNSDPLINVDQLEGKSVPAAAEIPALKAYVQVVAVKKQLVVGFWAHVKCQPLVGRCAFTFVLGSPMVVNSVVVGHRPFALKKLDCSKQAVAQID